MLTSAVRDAANGAEFTELVRSQFDLDARVLSGDEEAQLTFLGAMSDRDAATATEPTVVIDIGGGSTEFIVGADHTASFHVSVQAGVLRMSERHIHSDPPSPTELQDLAADTRAIFLDGLPAEQRKAVTRAIAVAGTATSAAAIDQELDPYDPERVHGYDLLLATVELLIARLADMTEARRREVVGLHPDRAPTIVAGMILLEEAMKAFDLDHVEVSEHDILRGGTLRWRASAEARRQRGSWPSSADLEGRWTVVGTNIYPINPFALPSRRGPTGSGGMGLCRIPPRPVHRPEHCRAIGDPACGPPYPASETRTPAIVSRPSP